MVDALWDLFNMTGGMDKVWVDGRWEGGWKNDTNWGVGEPCINGWYGVVCCPEHMPIVDGNGNCYPEVGDDGLGALDPNGNATGSDAFNNVDGDLVPYQDFPAGVTQAWIASIVKGGGEDGEGEGGADAARARRALQETRASRTFQNGGCHSGTYTGRAPTDYAKCVVVALNLQANGLIGRLSLAAAGGDGSGNATANTARNVLCSLPYLQYLSLAENSLGGPLPDDVSGGDFNAMSNTTGTCLPRLRHLDVQDNRFEGRLPTFIAHRRIRVARLGSIHFNRNDPKGNAFVYPPNRTGEVGLEPLFIECELKELRYPTGAYPGGCTGFPGGSTPTCDAFGGEAIQYVPRLSARSRLRCQRCPDNYANYLFLGVGVFLLMFLILCAYAWLVLKKASGMQMWVASFSIVWYHMATLSIVGSLRLDWPPSVKMFTSSVGLTFFGVDFINPLCFARQFGPFLNMYIATIQLGFYVVMLFLPSVLGLARRLLCVARTDEDEERNERWFDRFEFLQTIIFAMQLTPSWKVCLQIITLFDFDQVVENDVAGLALTAFVGMVALLVLDVLVVSKYAISMFKLRTVGSWERCGLTPTRLRRRLAYMTNRYDEHARHHWQFVIWGRLLLLTLTSQSMSFVEAWQRRAFKEDDEAGVSNDGLEASVEQTVRWVHALVAVLILCVFGLWHHRTQPYKWRFQNNVESALFVADVFVIGLAVTYTLAGDGATEGSISRIIIEALLLLVVVGSLLAALAISLRRYLQDRAAKRVEKAKQRKDDAYRTEGRANIARENMWRLGRNNDKVACTRARGTSRGGLRVSSLKNDLYGVGCRISKAVRSRVTSGDGRESCESSGRSNGSSVSERSHRSTAISSHWQRAGMHFRRSRDVSSARGGVDSERSTSQHRRGSRRSVRTGVPTLGRGASAYPACGAISEESTRVDEDPTTFDVHVEIDPPREPSTGRNMRSVMQASRLKAQLKKAGSSSGVPPGPTNPRIPTDGSRGVLHSEHI